MNQIDYNKKTVFSLLAFALLSGFLALAEILTDYNNSLTLIVSMVSVIMSVYLCYIYRYNIGLYLVMLFIAYTNYSITVGVYLDSSIRPQWIYAQFTQKGTYGIGIVCIYIFVASLILLSYKIIMNPHCIDNNSKNNKSIYEYNEIIAWASPSLFLAIFILNFALNADGTRGGSSALGEYRVIIFIIGSYYSGKKKTLRYIWSIIIIVTSVLIFISKNRVDSFPPIIFLIIYWYPTILNYKRIMVVIPFFVILMISVGAYRHSGSGSLFRPIEAIETIKNDKLTYDGAIYAYMPAMATIELSKITTWKEKEYLLLQHIMYIFKFGAAGTSRASLSAWSRNYYFHCMGFISPVYFYFWFGYIGAFLFAFLVNLYKSLYLYAVSKESILFKDKVAYLFSLYFICNVARWYEYGPMPLLRGIFIFFIAFCIVYLFNTITNKEI